MSHHYHINVFWAADDGCWIADVPDLKPCSAHGDTAAEAVAEAEVAVALWLEIAAERGLPIPEARYRPAIYAAA
ncbi:putative RNase H-like HicB family nuclease [Novosphingobium chloroacetimidivorans]|uniref:Putative RNase H-like HicB family nuclease n=1 Tax=Novosphingobium chloroacetimidivorans TaxID=1428314 RepID=A0A7W7KCP6_9SPHN|nr:type II toxin-antitoxin system HicB family antitoxin [Novosphingobium chloroacetimidivorans]MBB4860414.1 putative RNase H-like HicB family nuclease [Novosphingobium chloroacetimidivorans]